MSSLPPPVHPAYLTEWSWRHVVPPPPHVIAVEDHFSWARMIARSVRSSFNFRKSSQESMDLEQVALLAVVELAQRFDPSLVPPGGDLVRAFRGWATIEVRNRCRREARRLRNGGTYNTRREIHGELLVVQSLAEIEPPVDPRSVVRDDPDADEEVGD